MSQGMHFCFGGVTTSSSVFVPSSADAVPRPNFIDDKDQKVIEHPLHCSICCDVSFNPMITPCEHVFCRECIENGLRSAPCCPNDRRLLERTQLRSISGLHEYIYNRTTVQCPKCEKWTGAMQHYKEHVSTCNTSSYVQSLELKIRQLMFQHEREVDDLNEEIDMLQMEIARHTHVLTTRTEQCNQTHAAEKIQLQNLINVSQNTISSLESRIASMGPSFNSNYGYNHTNISDLCQIICRNLFDKPNNIDGNRIFNCVKNCYFDARHDHDNALNLNMLLTICYASNWFSYNQRCRIVEWFRTIRMAI